MASEGGRQDAAAWLVMAVALGLVLLSWRIAVERDRHDAEQRFRAASDDLAAAIVGRIDGCELALRAAVALFDASGRVDRDEWGRFVAALRPVESIPGIAGLGFARAIDDADGAAFVEALRAEGFDDVTLRPDSPDGRRGVIDLLEPLADPRNRRAIGYDMAADPVRRAAMAIARDTGRPALSGPVRLVQDAGETVATPGVVMYRPVARPVSGRDVPPPRDALLGWVYAPMRLDDLLHGVAPRDTPGLVFEVLDGDAATDATRLYASASIDAPPFDGRRTLELPGRRWTLRVAGTDAFAAAARSARPAQVATVGALALTLLGLYLRAAPTPRPRGSRPRSTAAGSPSARCATASGASARSSRPRRSGC